MAKHREPVAERYTVNGDVAEASVVRDRTVEGVDVWIVTVRCPARYSLGKDAADNGWTAQAEVSGLDAAFKLANDAIDNFEKIWKKYEEFSAARAVVRGAFEDTAAALRPAPQVKPGTISATTMISGTTITKK